MVLSSKSVSPPQFLEVPSEGLTVSLSHPSGWRGSGNRRGFLGTAWGGGARKSDRKAKFERPVPAVQAGL